MKNPHAPLSRAAAIAALTLAITAIPATPPFARADDGTIKVETPRVRMTIPGRPAAGYMVVKNAGTTPDSLTAAHSPQAKRIELHTHSMDGGIMRMRQIQKVDVPSSGEVAFSSGGHHLMIFGLKPEVKPGASISITLTFEKGGDVQLNFPVESIGSKNKATATGHSGHKHKH